MLTKKANFYNVLKNIYFAKKEPVSIVHFVTNRCNARCSFCFIDFDHPEIFAQELSIEEKFGFTWGTLRIHFLFEV